MSPSNRSKSPPKVTRQADSSPKRSISNDTINTERLKLARDEAERAMKEHKIFTIIGPYPALRESLRRRGWVEKFYRGSTLPSVHGNKKSDKKNNKSDDDDDDGDNNDDDNNDDDDLDEHPSYEDDDKIPPWEENDGYYGLLSRLVRTAAPNFIWSVRATYDTSTLNKDQMVNHYSRNGCFTTKVGLCSSLRNLQWFHSGCADEFYPRCYKVSQEDDKVAFIDDYRLTACISFLKLIQNRCKGIIEPDMNSILAMSSDDPTDPKSPLTTIEEQPQLTRSLTMPPGQLSSKSFNGKTSLTKKVPLSFIEFALNKVNHYTLSRDHEDIDINANLQLDPSDEQWTQFIEQFYAASHSNAEIEGMEMYLNKIDACLKNVVHHCPQYHIDGTRNIWILKPGAKSRGRGIVVYDRLEDILKLCSSTLTKDGKFVVQKYIERPLLIHNTKFDIRQWFLVTDWNPLTIWMFKDCYLRFCTEHFSLETRQQSVHLCNYSIQKHYKNNSNRHIDLPAENMWTNKEFSDKYLRPNRLADRWDKLIYPAMKDAIICSMLVAQDTIDPRKNSFELFGADFMLGEDLKPWLIEINCSPTMARSTVVTTEMCDGVLEDTCKVMIDRRYNRTADTGRFELIHKGTPVPVPIYVGIDLRVEGKTCKTGRTSNNNPMTIVETQNNNNNNNTINTHVSAPPHTSSSSMSSSSLSASPAENRPILPHSASALATTHQSLFSKNSNSNTPISLKLRREMTQPALTRIEVIPSSDSPLEKLATSDNFLFQYRSISNNNNNNKLNQNQQSDIRQKQLKISSNRLSVDYLPVRQLSRSKVNSGLPSPKDVKLPNHFSLNRQYQRACLLSRLQQPSITTNLKPVKQPKSTTESSHFITVSILSIPSTIGTMSILDANNGPSASSSSILTAV
ncbi:unnamed protein product [Rotaria sp. Silwood2]|nr:unnamed protein product [Rotaria sp. Silwood2]CAF2641801.1 unnamed protein product [Rotaria sp. Silwood2]CAF3018204.1 unnamed protein product [Rotaria sp. Silwood2]CAF4072544.1 unnamed protein product [Rotaria sp. Silwood2]CAF4179878.1 unnamed protein product [Rotaria sp. Silwood2]